MISKSSMAVKNDIGRIFIKENIQRLLKEITRFDESIVFARRSVPRLKTPKLLFMSDEQLKLAKESAYDEAKARLQMPPVLAADMSQPKVISHDPEIVGYSKFKVMFVDISHGNSNKSRLMSVRETNGTLRFPTHEERSRLNNMFYPENFISLDAPKLFEGEHLMRLLKKREYVYVLNRACVQFEPDDPRYTAVTSQVYDHIDKVGDYDKLRSTRHFGPMALYLAYNKQAEKLKQEMISRGLIDDAKKLVQIYRTCHDIEPLMDDLQFE